MWGGSQGASFGTNRAGAQAASNMWYNGELNKFPSSDYGKGNPGGNFHEWGHFSQLVWAGTREVGCVSKVCPAGTMSSMESIYTVCNYAPAGTSFPASTQSSLLMLYRKHGWRVCQQRPRSAGHARRGCLMI